MIYVDNDAMLTKYLSADIQSAMNSIVDDILDLLKESIDTQVYERYSPSFYERTYEFREAWEDKINNLVNGAEGTIEYDPSQLSFNPDAWQHGSYISGSSAEYLADIIFNGAIGYICNFPNIGTRDAWGDLEKYLGKNKRDLIGQIVKSALEKEGLTVR